MGLSIGMLRQALNHLRLPRVAIVGLAWAILVLSGPAFAAGPAETCRQTVAEALHILNDPHNQSPERKSLQQERLWGVLAEGFDFTEFSKRVLAEKWYAFLPAQRTEFVDVFSKFLGNYYLAQLLKHHTDETVTCQSQEMLGPARAVVKADLSWMNRLIPVEVRMLKHGGRWKAYDVSLIGFSVVQIYRTQFREIMRTHSPSQAIALVRNRMDE
jgi:phospholipid transport system substrate-binding protein